MRQTPPSGEERELIDMIAPKVMELAHQMLKEHSLNPDQDMSKVDLSKEYEVDIYPTQSGRWSVTLRKIDNNNEIRHADYESFTNELNHRIMGRSEAKGVAGRISGPDLTFERLEDLAVAMNVPTKGWIQRRDTEAHTPHQHVPHLTVRS